MVTNKPSASSVASSTHEHTFNLALAEILTQTTSRWQKDKGIVRAETKGLLINIDGSSSTKRPDILITDPAFPPVVIECSYSARDAEKDAIRRLGSKITNIESSPIVTAIAVHVDGHEYMDLQEPAIREILVKPDTLLSYALYQGEGDSNSPRRWPAKGGFVKGNVRHLSALIKSVACPKERLDNVGERVANTIISTGAELSQRLNPSTRSSIAKSVIGRHSAFDPMPTTMILWLNALLTQQRLHQQEVESVPPLPFDKPEAVDFKQQIDTWEHIITINWRAIFRPAVNALRETGNSSPRETNMALSALINAACIIETDYMGISMSVGAELFPKLSEDRKQAAAFYTQAGIAELLAALTIREDDLESPSLWASPDLFESHLLGDLACGTGTLLRTGYQRIIGLHESHDGEATSELHKTAMEGGVVGADISPIAAHLTSSGLAAIGSGEAYGDTQIGWVSVGSPVNSGSRKNELTTGSLELLDNPEVQDLFDTMSGTSGGGRSESTTDDDKSRSVLVLDDSLQWMLMNPPYSRTRGGQSAFDVSGIDEKTRKSCQKRWGHLIKNKPVNRKAGLAASFLALAHQKVKFDGRIGFVLPLTAAFADTWAITRAMVESEFKDIIAIAVQSGRALGSEALSADTHMEEMLLVATKCNSSRSDANNNASPATVHCVTLDHPVMRQGEAAEIARFVLDGCKAVKTLDVIKPIRIGEEHIGSIAMMEAASGAPWSLVGAANLELAIAARTLQRGILHFADDELKVPMPMTTIETLFNPGPTHHLIGNHSKNSTIGAFEVFENDTPHGSDKMLWSADSENQRCLVVQPTHRGIPREQVAKKKVKAMRDQAACTFYARNMRWTSQKLLVASTRRACMGGSSWLALSNDNPLIGKAFALWGNSTLGMLLQWSIGQRTHPGRSRSQVGAAKSTPCPDFMQASEKVLIAAGEAFDSLNRQQRSTPLQPAKDAYMDPVRHAIDEAVADMMGFGDSEKRLVEELRAAWCIEPSVHGGKSDRQITT